MAHNASRWYVNDVAIQQQAEPSITIDRVHPCPPTYQRYKQIGPRVGEVTIQVRFENNAALRELLDLLGWDTPENSALDTPIKADQ